MILTLLIGAVLILIPGIPVAISWYSVIAQGYSLRPFLKVGLPLLVISASMLLFMTGLFVPAAIGGDYSTRRFVTIYLNLFTALGMLVITTIAGRPLGWKVAISAGAVAMVWGFAAAVSSVV